MKRKQKPLQSHLLRRSNQVILIILGFAVLVGSLLSCVFLHTASIPRGSSFVDSGREGRRSDSVQAP